MPHPVCGTASGKDLTFQWFHNGTSIGEPSPIRRVRIRKVNSAVEGVYQCVVRNQHGSVTSEPLTVAIPRQQPRITHQPTAEPIQMEGVFEVNVRGAWGSLPAGLALVARHVTVSLLVMPRCRCWSYATVSLPDAVPAPVPAPISVVKTDIAHGAATSAPPSRPPQLWGTPFH
jgi:hypothetical protein